MPMNDPLTDIADLAAELCDPRQHVEPIYRWTPTRNRVLDRTHTTVHPGLLAQLRDAVRPTNAGQDTDSRAVPDSRPPLQLEAIARHIAIGMALNRWMWSLKITNRDKPEDNIRALVGAAAGLDRDTQHALRSEIRQWRSWAAVLSGWDSPPYCPRVRCPNPDCTGLSTLRVILDRKTAMCTACGHVWDERDGSINLLAAYISDQTSTPAPPAAPVRSGTEGHGGWAERRS